MAFLRCPGRKSEQMIKELVGEEESLFPGTIRADPKEWMERDVGQEFNLPPNLPIVGLQLLARGDNWSRPYF